MTEIYLIRHTQADGNIYRMIQGQLNGGVTGFGLRQIDALAERFRDVRLDGVYSSDLDRARLTAEGVGRYHSGLSVQTVPGLREMDLGRWEGCFFGDLKRVEPEMLRAFIYGTDDWFVPEAETFSGVGKRIEDSLRTIAEENEGRTVAAVSHGAAIRCFLSRALDIALDDFERLPHPSNTSVTKLVYERGSFRAEYINDFSHLDILGVQEWNRAPDLRAESFDPLTDRKFYTSCYRDSWHFAHGTAADFNPEPYLQSALEHFERYPGAVMRMFDADASAGLVDLDPIRGNHAGVGWISLLYLRPEYRHRGCGPQLLGRAVSFYSALGRKKLRLHVSEDNGPAKEFYSRFGFAPLSTESTPHGNLLLMEKKLGGMKRV